MQRILLVFLLLCAFVASSEAQTIVQRHGQLKVVGNKIKDECDRNVQLRGMSFFWSQWPGKEYYTNGVVKKLRDDWKATIVRAALAVRPGDGEDYLSKPNVNKNRITTVADAAVEHGIYVIIDWHAHPNRVNEAKAFFAEMAQKYKGVPNVIYEIWNEPIGDYGNSAAQNMWDNELKPYAEQVIAAIRDHDKNNIIVMGTPFYCQYPNVAVNNKITRDSKGRTTKNIAYTIHAYAGAHGATVRNQAQQALDGGLALIMTECGRVGTNYGPNNNIDQAEWDRWEKWMDDNKISWCKWSMSNKNEVSSSLVPGAPTNGNWNINTHLTNEGRWNRNKLRNKNANLPSVCSNGGGGGSANDIVSVNAPKNLKRGATAKVTVNYEANGNRDIRIILQRNVNGKWTTLLQKKWDVGSGSGSRTHTFTVPTNAALASNYQWQTYITTDGGRWGQRFDNLRIGNVSIAAAATTSNHNIYTDNLNNRWRNWSWGGNATVRDGGVKRFGSYSFKYQMDGGDAVSFSHPDGRTGDNLVRLEFWARTWNTTNTFQVSASYDDNYGNRSTDRNRTVTSGWKKFTVTKAEMSNYGWYKRIFIRLPSGSGTIFLDNVRLVYASSSNRAAEEVVNVAFSDLDAITTEAAGEPTARLFPNPNAGAFTLDLQLPVRPEALSIDLVDPSGRLLRQQTETQLYAGLNKISLDYGRERLAPGLYFLRISDAAGTVQLTERVLIR